MEEITHNLKEGLMIKDVWMYQVVSELIFCPDLSSVQCFEFAYWKGLLLK